MTQPKLYIRAINLHNAFNAPNISPTVDKQFELGYLQALIDLLKLHDLDVVFLDHIDKQLTATERLIK